jgi:hypothetical protein
MTNPISPAYYKRGPGNVEAIDVIRHIGDSRLAAAQKYLWRVAFGGKENDRQDIKKAIWYLNDWLAHDVTELPNKHKHLGKKGTT